MLCAVAGAGCGGNGHAATAATVATRPAANTSSTAATTTTTTIVAPKPLSAAGIARRYGDAVWKVVGEGCGLEVTGTAWAIDAHHLVTNRHVVAVDPTPTVYGHDGRVLTPRVIGWRSDPDIAVLEVGATLAVTLRWAPAGTLTEGDRLVSLGYPAPANAFTVTTGGILSFDDEPVHHSAIRTDANLDHGNSGGPALTEDGHVAGVVTALDPNDGGVQLVVLIYTRAALSPSIAAIVAHPTSVAPDCSEVAPSDPTPDVTPALPQVPVLPPPTTARVQCPTSRPIINVTQVRGEPPAGLTSDVAPYFWQLHVVGTFTNTTGATVDGLSVMLFFDVAGSPTGTGQLDVKVPVGPGSTVSWSGEGVAETQTGVPPTTATISDAYWSYTDPALVLC